VASDCSIKCTKLALDLLGELIALPDPLAGLNIPYFYEGKESRNTLSINSYICPSGIVGLLGLILLILILNVQLIHLTYLTHH